jgi:hypothetical protein
VLLLPAGYLLYWKLHAEPRAQADREYDSLATLLLRHVRAEENAFPPPPAALTALPGGLPEDMRLLREGAAAFGRGEFGSARESFARLRELRPGRETLAMLAAANLRESNFSIAREHFQQLAADPFPDPGVQGAASLGLALALFNLADLEGALPHAESAYSERLSRLGRASPETLSAANILAGILIGLGRAPEAEGLLEPSVRAALEEGHISPATPVVADSLNILALSYGMRDSGKDVLDLLPPELAALAGPGRGRRGDGPGGGQEPPEDGLLPPDAEAGGRAPGPPPPPAPARTGGAGAPASPGSPVAAPGSGAAQARPPLNYPEMLSVYNSLTREHPHSRVRSALLEAMAGSLAPSPWPLCRDPGETQARESLWYLCVSLADALIAEGRFDRGFAVTGELLEWPEAQTGAARHQVFRNAAFQNAREGALAGSEEFLRLALAAAAASEELSPADVSFIILRTITLADTLLREGKRPLEAEIELTASLTLLERRLPRKALEGYPESPFLFWYLARVLREEGRGRDSRNYFERAIRAAESAAKASPENAAEYGRLAELLRTDRAWRRGRGEQPSFPQSPRIFFEAEALYAGRAHRPPPPETLRLELQGWKLLGRLEEFEPRLAEAIAAAEPGSIDLLRYRSLSLKYREELRDWPRLFAELELMTAAPPIEDPQARALFLSSARSYEARMRQAAGDPEAAAAAYVRAAELLAGMPDAEERRAEILRELAGLLERHPEAAAAAVAPPSLPAPAAAPLPPGGPAASPPGGPAPPAAGLTPPAVVQTPPAGG